MCGATANGGLCSGTQGIPFSIYSAQHKKIEHLFIGIIINAISRFVGILILRGFFLYPISFILFPTNINCHEYWANYPLVLCNWTFYSCFHLFFRSSYKNYNQFNDVFLLV